MSTLRSVEETAALIAALPNPGRIVVGIVGAPGAGKSTIAERLVALLPGAALLPMDGFHLPQSRLVELGRRDRMGAPDTFDVDAFAAVLAALRPSGATAAADAAAAAAAAAALNGNSGVTVVAPGFDREIEEPVPAAVVITPEFPIVVVEGNYLLLGDGGWERVAPLLDATFFVSVDRDIRLARLIARHERFGKSPADARAWALGPDERNAVLVEASSHAATHTIALG
ncbi:pantothenate kinase [Conyzicola nivalis]|uniref:Pantothenate kinase n=1 Tax=Conyzicola nivalis TaxID=1477021 RepID=A0ABV2QS72_9MICO